MHLSYARATDGGNGIRLPAAESVPQATGKRTRIPRLTGVLLIAGAACRIAQYASDRSFWEDEAYLVLNLRHRTAAALLQGLDYRQAAPPLFLLSERAMGVALGSTEYMLRLLPLLAGLIALVLMAALARRIVEPGAALLALALFAFSDRIIWHSAEVKPYSGDVMVALALTLSALAGEGRASPRMRLARAASLASVLIWYSYPAIFIFTGLSLALLFPVAHCRSDGRVGWRGIASYLAINVPVLVSFTLLYLLSVKRQHTPSLAAYWVNDFADLAHPMSWPLWLIRHLLGLCQYACVPLGPVVLVLGILGGASLAKAKRWCVLGALTLPLALVIGAAFIHHYPFDGGRVNAFLTPDLLLLAAAGATPIVKWWKVWWPAASSRSAPDSRRAWGAGWSKFDPRLLLVAAPLAGCACDLLFPRTRAHVREAVAYVAARAQPGDVIYCAPDVHQLLCYWPAAGGAPIPHALSIRIEKWEPEVSPPRSGRFWIVIAYSPGHERFLPALIQPAQAAGRCIDRFDGYGGEALLFQATTASQ